MIKGQYGLNLAAVAILAFVLGVFGFFFSTLVPMILIFAFALLLEKNHWFIRQTLQAFYLQIVYNLAVTVFGWVFSLLNSFFGLFEAIRVQTVLIKINDVIDALLYIALLVLTILAIIKLLKHQDASVPLVSNLVDYTMDLVEKPKPATAAPAAPAVPFAPAAPFAPFAPPAPAADEIAGVAEPAPEIADAPDSIPETPFVPLTPASAPTQAPAAVSGPWICACGRHNTGNFCIGCGGRRPQ